MTFGSLFAGIGGFDKGFHDAGFRCLWQVETDAKCRSVLARHFPEADRSVCDVREAGAKNLARVDIIVGGSPCQGFSVAGLRGGMNDDRSNLCLQYVRICNELDPAIIVWENVPGVLSDSTNAFGCFLAGLVGATAAIVPAAGQKWTRAGMVDGPVRFAAWRLLDSQYFEVAQRRPRMFVVASPRKELPGQILFVEAGGGRHPAPRRETGQGTAARAQDGTGSGCGYQVAPPLTASARGTERTGESRGQDCVVTDVAFGGRNTGPIEVATACNAHGERYDFESETFVVAPITSDWKRRPGAQSDDAESLVVTPDRIGMAVRRLTPTECDRLQGFPDGWTSGQSDSTRYRQIGNAVTVSVARWLAERVKASAGPAGPVCCA